MKGKEFDIPLIFIIKKEMSYEKLKIKEIISNKKNSSKDYLSSIKKILNLPNEVEETKGDKKSLLSKKMEEMNKKAEDNKGKELWVFFDEINTCLSLSLLTEIFVNKTFNGKKLNDNIRLIGACNPYRRREKEMERCGYGRENINDKELVYLVQPLPQSLLNYFFSFGSLTPEDEKEYIYSIIEKLFVEGEECMKQQKK